MNICGGHSGLVYMIQAVQVVSPNRETQHAGMMCFCGPKISSADINFALRRKIEREISSVEQYEAIAMHLSSLWSVHHIRGLKNVLGQRNEAIVLSLISVLSAKHLAAIFFFS